MQRALLQFGNPKNRALVLKALRQAGREDLIGMGKHYLVADFRPPVKKEEGKRPAAKGKSQREGGKKERAQRPTVKSGKNVKAEKPAKGGKPAAKPAAKAAGKPVKRGKR